MGLLLKGKWEDQDSVTKNGAYIRSASPMNGAQKRAVLEGIPKRRKRFVLIASKSCPWSHFTTIILKLKGLEKHIPVQYAGEPRDQGYSLDGGRAWPVPGSGAKIRRLHELYTMADKNYTGRATVPLLWDSKETKIVSNESRDIGRAFDLVELGNQGPGFLFVPPHMCGEISRANSRIYSGLNNAVYRAGFAKSQTAYEEAVDQVFKTLEDLEDHFSKNRFYFGPLLTEVDWRIFITLCRFDSIYHILFKCSRKRLVDYPNLWAYARDLYQTAGVRQTIDFGAMMAGSYLNDSYSRFPIVAVPPSIDWEASPKRNSFGPAKLFHKGKGPLPVDLKTLNFLERAAA